jgi:hypothetical protein
MTRSADNPTPLLDRLIRGALQFIYDFVRLTLAVLWFPFVIRSRRFWPAVVSTEKRLSSITFFFLWLLISFLTFQKLPLSSIAPNLAGFAKEPNFPLLRTTAQAVIIALLFDFLLRASTWWIRPSTRRRLYDSLLRLGLGGLFFGGALYFVLIRNLASSMPGMFHIPFLPFSDIAYLHPLALPIAAVANKAFSVTRLRYKLIVASSIILLLPYLLLTISLGGSIAIFEDVSSLFPSPSPKLLQKATRCKIASNDQIQVDTYLRLRNSNGMIIDGDILAITRGRSNWLFDDLEIIGREVTGLEDVMLSDTAFTKMHLTAKPDRPIPRDSALRNEPFDCDLTLLKLLDDDDGEVEIWTGTPTQKTGNSQ